MWTSPWLRPVVNGAGRLDRNDVEVPVLADLLRNRADDLLFQRVNETLLDQIPVDHKADLPHRCGPFEVTDQLLLPPAKIHRRQFRKDRDPVVELDHPAQSLETSGFI